MIKVLSFPKKKVKTIAQTISSTTAVLLIITLTAVDRVQTSTTKPQAPSVAIMEELELSVPTGVWKR